MRRGTAISRRQLLKGIGAAGVVLPFFSSLSPAYANPTAPKRLSLFFTPDGTIHNKWRTANATETNFQLNHILSPLQSFKQKLLVIDGLNNELPEKTADPHQRAVAQLFTGSNLKSTSHVKPLNASVDQHIAQFLKSKGSTSPHSSLLLNAQARVGSPHDRPESYLFYDTTGSPLAGYESPYEVFKVLFGGKTGGTSGVDRLHARRKSVLDQVLSELNSLKSTMSGNDKNTLDRHLTDVRELEKQVTTKANPNPSGSCQAPTLPQGKQIRGLKDYQDIGKMHMDLLAVALICNQTPVACLQWSRSVSENEYHWLGINKQHHKLTHNNVGQSKEKDEQDLVKIYHWYAQMFAYLVGKLDAAKEGSGTVLDNTALLWGSEFGDGRPHSFADLPFVLAGSAGGYFRPGRYLKYKGVSHNRLLVSLCHAMGDTRTTFGSQAFKNPLPGLR